MKRSLPICLSAVLLLTAIFALTGCMDMLEPKKTTPKFTFCQHTETEWATQQEPKCEVKGIEYKRCAKCKEFLEEERELPPLGHEYVDNKCTRCDSFKISDKEGLLAFAAAVSGGKSYARETVTLIADIDLGGEVWEPIATYMNNFGGTFDGNGHRISNFRIASKQEYPDSLGFFAYNRGTIKNLTLENATLSFNQESLGYAGLLVGDNDGKIENCHVYGTMSINSPSTWCDAGGLVGGNSSDISRCSAAVTIGIDCDKNKSVNSGCDVGGLVGGGEKESTLTDCYATGDINAFGWGGCQVGGLLGVSDAVITNCYATGNISSRVSAPQGTKNYAGGLVGAHGGYNGGKMKNCFATGNIETVGGEERGIGYIVGGIAADTPENCYSVEGQTAIGNTQTTVGTSINADTLKTAEFQKNTLKWSEDIWSLTDGGYPTLK